MWIITKEPASFHPTGVKNLEEATKVLTNLSFFNPETARKTFLLGLDVDISLM